MVARSTGQPPWVLGHEVSRRRFYETCAILAPWFELSTLWTALGHRCPLMGTG